MPATVTRKTLMDMKKDGKKIVASTAYDYPFARIADESGIHMLLVGDSLGMAVQGEANTLGVTMDQMIYHTRIVAKGAGTAMVIGDMPFMSYQVSMPEALTNAGRFLKESGASAIKLEGGAAVSETIRAMAEAGIPVMAHIGLTPQSVHQLGGYRVQRDRSRLIADADKVEAAGAFAVVLEGIPAEIAEEITGSLNIPTIGIGAGSACDGQILVLHDMLGISAGHVPKFVKKYAELRQNAMEGLRTYIDEVQNGIFPDKNHSY
ncbi:MAG: 3-methyl-2-oxobutanoate hydroxymethyltransferase [Desulfobacteraceae bacterium]|nr:3-methyl-2-oxobutanoate hydroxymethyltransferase [Desulfobacteraceae bacterium]MCF8095493.1 3-methyl-2-oxobutanoate hydroxymethyltransferase [Desulfobacteraceae bacterium]